MISNSELKDMINHETYCRDKATWNIDVISEKNHNKMLCILQELKERRECELRPATKISKGLTIRQEYEKFLDEVEEFKEVMEIYMNMTASNTEEEFDKAIKNVGLEGFDVQTVVETLLYKMGLAGKSRIELQKTGLKKNTERDYYDEK